MSETPAPPVNVESLARLFKMQADLTRKLYCQRLLLKSAPAEVFTASDAEQVSQQFRAARRRLQKIAERLEEVTGRQLPPIELFYT